MRIALACLGVSPFIGAGCAKKVPGPAAADVTPLSPRPLVQNLAPATQPLACTIRGEPTCELGKAPEVAVTITNQTNADMYLVGSLDASDCKWRYPHVYFEVIGPDGKSSVKAIARCGNMDPLREEDFVKVLPGGTFDPYQCIDNFGFFSAHQMDPRNFQTAGQYRIRFVYSTKSSRIVEWAGDGRESVAANEKLVGMFNQVPRVEVRSNELVVTVVEPGR